MSPRCKPGRLEGSNKPSFPFPMSSTEPNLHRNRMELQGNTSHGYGNTTPVWQQTTPGCRKAPPASTVWSAMPTRKRYHGAGNTNPSCCRSSHAATNQNLLCNRSNQDLHCGSTSPASLLPIPPANRSRPFRNRTLFRVAGSCHSHAPCSSNTMPFCHETSPNATSSSPCRN